jgi:dTDP-4-dehydrorhamnose reductase
LKVLITGASGQLGTTLRITAPPNYQLLACDAAQFDLTAPDLSARLGATGVDLVINAAAYTAVDKAESDEGRARAEAVNAIGAGALAAACASLGVRLIHISTDFVFDGAASSPYAVDARCAPLGQYGLSKWRGEQRVLAAQPDALVLRTAWVYSRHGGNFMKTMLRLMAERDAIGVVADQVGTPTSTVTLADAIWRFAARPQLRGVYHFTDAGVASWYDFAVAIQEEALARGLLQRRIPVRPIATADYPTPARRPAYSVLDKRATWRDLELEPQHWRVALRAVLDEMKTNHTADDKESING